MKRGDIFNIAAVIWVAPHAPAWVAWMAALGNIAIAIYLLGRGREK